MVTADASSAWFSPSRPIPYAPAVALVTLALMLPALIHGGAFLFFDSDQYFRVGQLMIDRVSGLFRGAGDAPAAIAPAVDAVAAAVPAGEPGGGLATIAGSRLPPYPLFLWLTSSLATIWLTALLQCLVCAVLIVRFCRVVWAGITWPALLGLSLALSILAGLGFQAAFMMPDVFTGCLALVLALYLFTPGQSRLETAFLLVAALVFAMAHNTNLLLVISALIAGLIVRFASRGSQTPSYQRLGIVAGVAVAAAVISAAWPIAIRIATGENVRSPPYLMARLIADGPGASYLSKACTSPSEPFATCAFAGRTFATSDDFIWKGESGGYGAASSALKSAIQSEEKSFVLAVIAADPVGVAVSALGNFATQATSAGIGEIGYGLPAYAQTTFFRSAEILKVTPGAQACLANAACAEPGWTTAWNAIVHTLNLLLVPGAILALIWLATAGRKTLATTGDQGLTLVRITGFQVLLLLANAAVCGILSGAFDRYQARLIWVLALALAALGRLLTRTILPSERGAGPATDGQGFVRQERT
jgi:hypothetical protein